MVNASEQGGHYSMDFLSSILLIPLYAPGEGRPLSPAMRTVEIVTRIERHKYAACGKRFGKVTFPIVPGRQVAVYKSNRMLDSGDGHHIY
jgi:hypothetical protein